MSRQSHYPRPAQSWITLAGWFIFMSSLVLISTLSMVPGRSVSSMTHLDKYLHFMAYGVLTVGLMLAWPKRILGLILAITFGWGVVIECFQGIFIQGRIASIWDALANGLGALSVIILWVCLYEIWYKGRRKPV